MTMLRASCVLAATLLHAGVAAAMFYFGMAGGDTSTEPPAKPPMPLLVTVGSAPAMTNVTVEPAEPKHEEAPAVVEETGQIVRPQSPLPGKETPPVRRFGNPPKASEPVAEKRVEETKPSLQEGAETRSKDVQGYTPKGPYPAKARERRWEGTVVLEFKIAKDGSCADARVVESSGFAILDREALRAIEKWRYPESCAGETFQFSYTYCLKCTDDRRCAKHAK